MTEAQIAEMSMACTLMTLLAMAAVQAAMLLG